ncbi:MAG: SOS response-associated peptidase [Myxococcales bacterium]|nr:SOS response-associated peptidase [Myxococcales bacterium]
MCGRFELTDDIDTIACEFNIDTDIEISPNFNIAPSQYIIVVRQNELGQNEIAQARWGLIPSWVSDLKRSPKPINAKIETAHVKPFFRYAFKKRRCLIPANGFFEWKLINDKKQPFLIHKKNNSLLYFAGLWELWQSDEGEVIETATILTTKAVGVITDVHDRMPIILSKKIFGNWLDIQNEDVEFIQAICAENENSHLEIVRVSPLVNSTRNNSPDCIKAI